MIKKFYVFVEGYDDEVFINQIFKDKLCLLKNYNIIQYSGMDNKTKRKYINSIQNNSSYDYVFLADQDGNQSAKNKILKKYSFLEPGKVFISAYEIESWIISGITKELQKKYKIKPMHADTSYITKEIFDNMIPNGVGRLSFILSILKNYDIASAADLNNSFNEFYNYMQKKAS